MLATLLAALSQAPLAAQRPTDGLLTPEVTLLERLWGGLTLGVQIPRGELGDFVGVGYELRANLLVDLVSDGLLGLRLSGTGTYFPDQSVGTPVSGLGSVSVGNRSVSLDLGPQVTVPSGPLRPYGFATVGAAFIRTSHSLGGSLSPDPYAPDYSDLTHVLSLGGGFYIPVSSGDRSIALDLSAQHRWNGDARVLGENSVTPGVSGFLFDPIEVGADVFVVELGVVVGL